MKRPFATLQIRYQSTMPSCSEGRIREEDEVQRPKVRGNSLPSLLLSILSESILYKAIFFVSGLAYWLLYAFSSGMLFYYSIDVSPYIAADQIPNPSIFLDFRTLSNLYYSGIVWYPNGHLLIVLFIGSTFLSIILSSLFAFNILLSSYGFRLKGFNNARKSGLGGIAGLFLSLFSGGCCAMPFATLLFGSILPSSVLAAVEFEHPFLLNLFIIGVMLISLLYASKKIARRNELNPPCSCEAEEARS